MYRSVRAALLVIALSFIALCVWTVPALADDGSTAAEAGTSLWTVMSSWLVPVGLGLLACGAVPAARAAGVVRAGWLALGVSAIGYWLCGFAFQFGGLGFIVDHPDLSGLVREWTWSPLDKMWGVEWGMLGLEGYFLRGPASTPTALALLFSQLPWITTAVAIPLWSLQGRTGPITRFLSGVLIAFVYTLLGNWTWGGGWLANLGLNLGLGHGFVDLTGASAVHLAGAACALAGMLAFGTRGSARTAKQLALPTLDVPEAGSGLRVAEDGETYVPMPPLHLPLLATLGAWLALIGSVGWATSTPAQIAAGLDVAWVELGIGLVLAAGGGAVVALAFSWLTTGEGNALLAARGAMGAVVAVGAGLPFIPSWAALAIGAGAGLLVPMVQYTVSHLLRLDDATSALATHGFPALWGLLAVGILSDGHAGEGWNRVGGQGVTGRLAAAGYAPHWPGQFQAQATGAMATFLTAFVLSWLLFATIQSLTNAWQGEYTIRLPRRPRSGQARPRKRGQRGPRVRLIRTEKRAPERVPDAKTSAAPVETSTRSLLSGVRSWGQRAKGYAGTLLGKKPSPRDQETEGDETGSADDQGIDV